MAKKPARKPRTIAVVEGEPATPANFPPSFDGEPVAESAQTSFPFGANKKPPIDSAYVRQLAVVENTIETLKGKNMAKTATKRKAVRKAAAPKTKAGRKAGGVNKSAAIREYEAAHKGASIQEIANALGGEAKGFTYNGVYQALKGGKKKTGKKRGRKPGGTTKRPIDVGNGILWGNGTMPNGVGALPNHALDFITDAGGLDNAIGILLTVKAIAEAGRN